MLHSLIQAQKAPRHPSRRQPSWVGAPKGRETQRQLLDCSQDEQANSRSASSAIDRNQVAWSHAWRTEHVGCVVPSKYG